MQVEVEGLSRRFGGVKALDDVCFNLPPGRRTALVGPNGSGKSTLNRVLAGLLAHEGRVRLDGMAPRARAPQLARRVAYLPQQAPRLAAPVRELVRALAELRGIAPATVAARAAELGLSLEEVAQQPLQALSGGMRQKLLLAATLAAPVSLFILDEPTGSLDPAARQRFFRAFHEVASAATVVLCSHRLEEVRALVDHVLVLQEGRLIYDGGAGGFLESRSAYVVELQAEGGAAQRWLQERGFRPGAAGWWSRRAGAQEKQKLVQAMASELGPALLDLEVRPLEDLAFPAETGRA